jgi:hypothetical protein
MFAEEVGFNTFAAHKTCEEEEEEAREHDDCFARVFHMWADPE